MEVIELLIELGAKPRVIVVLMDKKGVDTISNVPIQSLVKIVRLD
jgi:orotate phosphoribosyltransferase